MMHNARHCGSMNGTSLGAQSTDPASAVSWSHYHIDKISKRTFNVLYFSLWTAPSQTLLGVVLCKKSQITQYTTCQWRANNLLSYLFLCLVLNMSFFSQSVSIRLKSNWNKLYIIFLLQCIFLLCESGTYLYKTHPYPKGKKNDMIPLDGFIRLTNIFALTSQQHLFSYSL